MTSTWRLVLMLTTLICSTTSQWCEPTEIGARFTMECRGSDLCKDRDLLWTIDTGGGSTTNVSLCHAKTVDCTDYLPELYAAAKHDEPVGNSTFRITIPVLKKEHQGTTLTCSALETGNEGSRKYRSIDHCIIDAYIKPENANCVAKKIGKHQIRLQCSTTRAYPGLVCEISQIDEAIYSLVEVDKSKVTYTKTLTDSDEHTCEVDIYVPFAGNFTYIAVMYPRMKQFDMRRMSIPTRATPPIVIDENLASVNLRREDFSNDLCTGRDHSFNFRCKAFCFPSEPQFLWYMDDEKMSEVTSTLTFEEPNGETLMFESTFSLKWENFYDGEELTCSIRHSDFYREVNSTERLNFRWPPGEAPVFLDPAGHSADRKVVVIAERGPSTFGCRVAGGRPRVLKTHLTCWKMNHGKSPGKEIIFEKDNKTDEVYFDADGSVGETWECQCLADHPTGCYNLNSTIVIDFVSETSSGTHGHQEGGLEIIIAVLIIVVFITPIAVLVLKLGISLCLSRSRIGTPSLRRHHDPEDNVYDEIPENATAIELAHCEKAWDNNGHIASNGDLKHINACKMEIKLADVREVTTFEDDAGYLIPRTESGDDRTSTLMKR